MSHPLNTIREEKDCMVITENGIEYICDKHPGVTAADILIGDFHPRGNYRKTFLVEVFQDDVKMKETYKAFATQEEMDRAWKIYAEVMDCM